MLNFAYTDLKDNFCIYSSRMIKSIELSQLLFTRAMKEAK